ncbi:hypothetical protein EI94DRAFT_1684936 [Lactarius quietus]|nr:hypothetical protein EI94DRAFT_1684936 [Lactarius quietus]
MMSLTVFSLLASLVPLALAQTSSDSTLIPSGISSTCQDYYSQLNTNTSVAACLNPLISATSLFSPNSTSTISSSTINSTLNNICSLNSCPALINDQLAKFAQACQPELTQEKSPDVIATYDILYNLPLIQQSLCLKDSSGNYCVVNVTSHTSTSTTKRSSLDRRDNSQVPLVQELTGYGEADIPFLTLQSNMTAQQLCTSCTQKVMTVYTTQLNSVPYAPGINSSFLLSGQPALYAAINSKCGATFLSGEVQAAGALSTGAAPRAADAASALLGSVIVAVAAGAIAVL